MISRIGEYPLSIGECSECNLAFRTSQPPIQESIDYMNWRWSSTNHQDRYITDIEGKISFCTKRLRWLDSISLPNNRLLDIGAGNGAFCYTAKNFGYEVTGTEISSQAVKRAKELFNVQLLLGDIDILPRYQKFGIVTMWDVIEHLRSPLKMLEQVRDLMVDGGIIIIETGNYESINRLAMKANWGLYLFDHMFYFSPNSLKEVLHLAGFSDFKICQIPSENLISSARRMRNIIKNPILIIRFLLMKVRHQIAITEAKKKWPRHWDLNMLLVSARKHSE